MLITPYLYSHTAYYLHYTPQGANTLIMNLLTSFADDKEAPPVRTLDGIETLDDDEDSDWLGEYQRGCDWEIYTTELSRCVVYLIYRVLQCMFCNLCRVKYSVLYSVQYVTCLLIVCLLNSFTPTHFYAYTTNYYTTHTT